MVSSKCRPLRVGQEFSDEVSATPVNNSLTDLKSEAAAEEAEPSPQDGGTGAWLFLIGASIIEVISWGTFFPVIHRKVLTLV